MICLRSATSFMQHHHGLGSGGGGGAEMGSNLSKRRSQSSGNLTSRSSGGKLPDDKYKLCGSLPNHLDLPNDNNNEVAAPAVAAVPAKGSYHHHKPHAPPPPVTVPAPVAAGRTEDLGYGSERSPDDPEPPFPACPVHHAHFLKKYPFINSSSIFSVTVKKGSGGLGLSVAGGDPWPGLIRIKRLFPHQPASHSGLLTSGDILLAASGVPLLGLTNYEALEVLRSSPPEVKLTVCRPPEPVVPLADSTNSAPPPPPPRDPLSIPAPPDQYGEFEILMEKVNGSLGFTLRKEDQSVLGHYVRALVREPALSDPRIRPGDKIVAVNDVEMSSLTHEEAVAFLRQCGELVRLRLYRDPAQTPVPAHSPPHTHRTFKPILRKEAQDMLSELAVKKSQSPHESSGSSKGSSPRKRRLTRTPPPAERSDSLESTIAEARPARVETSHSMSEHKVTDYSSNLATQSSEEELVATGLSGNVPPPSEPVSMPPLSGHDPEESDGVGFSYRNPAYRSATTQPISKSMTAHEIQDNGCSEQDIPTAVEGTKSLLKWKGVILYGEEDGEEGDGGHSEGTSNTDLGHSDSVSSQHQPASVANRLEPADQDGDSDYQVVIVELNRGWNSRLGFSLRSVEGGGSVISAVYPDSVASRDGRLREGDKLINVNDEAIDSMETTEVIDLLRKIRGSISLTLLRARRV